MGSTFIERHCSRCARVTRHEIPPGAAAFCTRCRDLDAEAQGRLSAEERETEIRRRVLIADAQRREAEKPRWLKIATPFTVAAVIAVVLVGMALTGAEDPITAVVWLFEGRWR